MLIQAIYTHCGSDSPFPRGLSEAKTFQAVLLPILYVSYSNFNTVVYAHQNTHTNLVRMTQSRSYDMVHWLLCKLLIPLHKGNKEIRGNA